MFCSSALVVVESPRIPGLSLVKGMALIRRRLLLWHQEALEPSTA